MNNLNYPTRCYDCHKVLTSEEAENNQYEIVSPDFGTVGMIIYYCDSCMQKPGSSK